MIEVTSMFLSAIEISCRSTPVHEEISPGDERTFFAHQQFGDIRHFIGCTGTPCRASGEHVLVEIAPRSVELIKSKRRDDNAGRNGVDACASLALLDGFRHDALHVATLGKLVGMKRVADVLRLQHVEAEQFFGRRAGKLAVNVLSKSRQTVS